VHVSINKLIIYASKTILNHSLYLILDELNQLEQRLSFTNLDVVLKKPQIKLFEVFVLLHKM